MLILKISLAFTASAVLAAELPVRHVVLYKHGVGYFERSGTVGAGETVRLDFDASEMNDVLKSLRVADRSGASIQSIRYDAADPASRALGRSPLTLGEQQPVSALLDQLKGARIEVRTGGEVLAGIVLSARLAPATASHPQQEFVTLLLDSGEIRQTDLASASGLRFADAALQRQLRDYLAILAQGRSREKRAIHIEAPSGKPHELVAAYLTPSSIWKSTYRLVFGAADATLEGWAIVDNTSGEDWSGVTLALVSGRPVSFITEIYQPRYKDRPVAELPEYASARPVLYGGVIGGITGGLADQHREADGAASAKSERLARQSAAMEMRPSAPANFAADSLSTVAVNARGRDAGELFEYRFNEPVTVPKNQSAMLPFLQQKIQARKLLIYSDLNAEHPAAAAELINQTGKTLDGGPITIYDGASYAGEALVETIKAGDKRLINYAVDLGTRITTKFDSGASIVREVRFARGVMISKTAAQEAKTFSVRNVDAREKTLIIEHPVRPEYKLLSPKPLETTAHHYRFELKLPASGSAQLTLSEERVFDQQTAIANVTPELIARLLQNKDLSPAQRKQLEAIAALKQQIATAAREAAAAERAIEDIRRDQERIRQNIDSLNRVSGQQEQVQRYSRELTLQEAKLATLRDELHAATKRKSAHEAALNTVIEKMP